MLERGLDLEAESSSSPPFPSQILVKFVPIHRHPFSGTCSHWHPDSNKNPWTFVSNNRFLLFYIETQRAGSRETCNQRASGSNWVSLGYRQVTKLSSRAQTLDSATLAPCLCDLEQFTQPAYACVCSTKTVCWSLRDRAVAL